MKEKNLFNVGLATLNPPHNHRTYDFPHRDGGRQICYTVAPHKLICPQVKYTLKTLLYHKKKN
jgi:hypothetical protein